MTDLGDMEHQVESLDKELRDIVDAVPNIIYRVDADGRVVFISEAVRRYGLEPEALVGVSFFDLIHPEDRDTPVTTSTTAARVALLRGPSRSAE